MRQDLVCLIILFFQSVAMSAQETPGEQASVAAPFRWTMEQCVAYALEHSAAVRKARIAEDDSKAEVRLARMSFLPSVGGDVSGQFSWGRNIDPETNSYNNVATFNNYYGLSAALTLFDGGRSWNALRQAKTEMLKAMSETEKASGDKTLEVVAAYIDAAYCEACVELAESKLEDSRALLATTRRQEELGLKGVPDVVLAEAQVAEDEYGVVSSRNNARLAVLTLNRVIGREAAKEPLVYPEQRDYNGSSEQWDSENHKSLAVLVSTAETRLRIAELDAESARLDFLMARGALLPTLRLNAGVATNYFRTIGSASPGQTFRSQFKNNMGEYVSASLSVPLFDGLQRKTAVRKAKNRWVAARIECNEERLSLNCEAEKARLERDGCHCEIESLRRKVEADEAAHQLNTRKYGEGLLSAIELRTSAQTLAAARLALLQKEMLLIVKEITAEYYGQNIR